MLQHRTAQKRYAVAELLEAVDTVRDADPTIGPNARKLRKECVLVVRSLTDLAMAEPFGVATAILRAIRRLGAML